MMSGVLLCIGHGYTARALARLLLAKGGWRIVGTTRSSDNFARLESSGAEAIVWPGSDLGEALREASHVLISAAPDEDGDPVLRQEGRLLAEVAKSLSWAGYLSTTAVYGDHKGGWVDERTPTRPKTKRGRLRIQAEEGWQTLRKNTGFPVHVFRLAGIYGPGRGPLARLQGGGSVRVVRDGPAFNRIHVDDIARILEASMRKPRAGAVYNVCDNAPATSGEVAGYCANLLGLPVPEPIDLERANLSPMARSFYLESKRVSNQLVKRELKLALRFPTYTAGFTALLNANVRGQ